ncbi:MAG: UvrD-helicase domain-containing protein, partial [Deltaproteobacteria bacterium]|nr:UvrD-helicase domain-containing protein [Deltaproteobacteria bacterium]
MKNFDLINTPLQGTNLIEASAGTGKTYTIASLFVRLILEAGLSADQILVVTFTRAATEELNDRIRQKLLQTKADFMKGKSRDPFIDSLVIRYPEPLQAIQTLQDALIDFDKAAIFTIHGFCHKMLHEHAFETGSLYNTELITDPSNFIQEVADDFWRKYFYFLPPELLSYAYKNKNITAPAYFMKLLERVRNPDVKIIPEIEKPELKTLLEFRHLFQTLKRAWPDSRSVIKERLKDPALSGTVYGSMKPKAQTPNMTGRDLKVIVLMDRMDRFVSDASVGYPLFKDFEKFSVSKLNRSVKKNHQPPSHEIFHICDRMIQKGAELEGQMAQYLIFLKAEFLRFAERELSREKRIKNVQFYDDLLLRVRKALIDGKREGDNLIAKTIRQKYRAALVDEFQDTDAIQYDIFSMLFASKNNVLFMIGDPKQSIYSFRGADIFSYMEAAGKVESKYTLSENWRSTPGLITAVNTIFSNVKKPFVFHDIPFEKGESGKLPTIKSGLPGADLKLWYVPAEGKKPLNKSDAVRSITEAMSAEILRLISSLDSEPIHPADIAVLVRTNRQAQIVK